MAPRKKKGETPPANAEASDLAAAEAAGEAEIITDAELGSEGAVTDPDLGEEDLGEEDFAEDGFEDEDDEADDDEGEEDAGPRPAPPPLSGPTRCGFVALLGAPNAGKSTLTNALVGTKVSIVSHKVQTTRAIVRGIALDGPSQIVLVDTPGIFSPKRRLERAMVTSAWTHAADADVIALLVDAKRGLDADIEALLVPLKDIRKPRALILNKIDLIRRDTLLALAAQINAILPFDRVFMVSALTGDGVEDVRRWFAETVPPGPWLYPEDQVSDAPMRMLAAEITREKMFLRLHDELPYRSTVETESWKELRNGSVRIEQTIYVERESQRKIVLGKGGSTIKTISSESRAEISEIIEAPVHLFLFVKVRESWADDPERYREMGLEFPKGG
ncbi:GTPase Era [Xanthobacter sp. KR7-65]|uniref:GTPase Era n=1 Tax=Xanthobacter sp. KR7-65 TaxID=3156612 RepID=UPI0032B43049